MVETPHTINFPSPHVIYFPDCDCIEVENRKEAERKIKAEMQAIMKSRIPAKFQSCTLESYIPKNKKQQAGLNAIKQNIFGSFYIYGAYGSGKTHLLCAQFRECFQKTKSFLRTTSELIHEIRQEELGNSASEIMTKLRQRENFHLFWDDCDKVKTTDFKLEILFDLIDGIYKHEMSLSITGNSNLAELQSKLSPAIIRRIDDICKVIEI